jgi:pimeloyl-ACP methyl ester carboxylesterase
MIQFVTCDQGRFAYLSWGDEAHPLVLCLHGFPDTPHSFEAFAVEMAAKGYRVIAPFLRGYAPSPLTGSMAPEQLAEDVAALTRAFSPGEPIVLLGHDWGAAIAYLTLSEHPELYTKAITLSVPHPVAFLQSWLRTPSQLGRSWYMFFFQLGPLADLVVKRDDFALIRRLWKAWSPGYQLTAEKWHPIRECLSQSMPHPVDYYRNMFWPPTKSMSRLKDAKKVSVPVLYLHGAQDGCISLEACRGQEKFFTRGLREEVLDGAGHFIPVEAPTQLAQVVDGWLAART